MPADLPARRHEERVVEQRVCSADGEERRRKTGQVGVQRRHGRVTTILEAHVAEVEIAERLHVRTSQDQRLVVRAARARRPGQVVDAIDEVGSEEPVRSPDVVANAEQGRRGEARACRLAADQELRGPEFVSACSTSQFATDSQSSGPAGYGCSGASL